MNMAFRSVHNLSPNYFTSLVLQDTFSNLSVFGFPAPPFLGKLIFTFSTYHTPLTFQYPAQIALPFNTFYDAHWQD